MSINILMPALSPTMTEGKLAKWHVKEGDTVKSGQVVAAVCLNDSRERGSLGAGHCINDDNVTKCRSDSVRIAGIPDEHLLELAEAGLELLDGTD